MKKLILSLTLLLGAHSAIAQTLSSQLESEEQSYYGCSLQNYRFQAPDPITHENRWIEIKFYRARQSDRAVLILPPTGGTNVLDQGYANTFCAQGIHAIIVSDWEFHATTDWDLGVHDRAAMRALAAVQQSLDFVQSQGLQKIGIMGTSIGGITSTLALGVDPRLKVGTIIVGSSRFADVVAESDEKGALELRKLRQEKFGYKTSEEYRSALRQAIQFEPSKNLQALQQKEIFVIAASEDTTVPTVYQEELSIQTNSKYFLKLSGNHFNVILKTYLLKRQKIVEFFKANL